MGYCLTKAKQSQGFSVAKLHDLVDSNSQINLFVWDPTESVATRPLFMLANPGNYKLFYTFDGNKNVSELVHFESRNGIAAHYDYAPFGAVTRAVNISAISARNFHLENPFRFSSEYHDDTLGLVYYNYRHYNPIDGRWCGRDLVEESNENLYSMCKNEVGKSLDYLGLSIVSRLRCWWNGCDKTTSVDLNKVYSPDETDFEVRSDYTNYKIFIAGPTGQGPGIGDSSLLLNFYMKNQSGWTSLWKSPEMKEMLKNRTLYGWSVNCRKRYLCAVKQICYKESPNCPCATWESAMPVYYIGIVRLKNKYRLEFYCDTFPDSLFVERDCERTYVEQK